MTDAQQTKEIVRMIVGTLLEMSAEMPPDAFRALFCGGVITNVAGNLPEEYWREFCRIEPCDQPGCDCAETMQFQFVQALTKLREDHRKTLRERNPAT